MTNVQKFKEFFGFGPAEDYVAEDEYYGSARPSTDYKQESRYERSYGSYSQPRYEPSVVTVHLNSYQEARQLGEPFRDGDAVIFDMTAMDTADARRIVDFAAGLVFNARGTMEKVGRKMFAIIPEGMDITVSELERAARR
ncbi:MAG: cell division protein SepF [Corynebacterium glucuronolyticum]|nr:cell division protein SepF [Corynebacterium glucuronolyticum]MDD7587465.1 cell division protein SepF [Mycobacteriaceae bacterium]MDY5834430.1 cell division protein SepF [Corynebacterium glucuronolyticum]